MDSEGQQRVGAAAPRTVPYLRQMLIWAESIGDRKWIAELRAELQAAADGLTALDGGGKRG